MQAICEDCDQPFEVPPGPHRPSTRCKPCQVAHHLELVNRTNWKKRLAKVGIRYNTNYPVTDWLRFAYEIASAPITLIDSPSADWTPGARFEINQVMASKGYTLRSKAPVWSCWEPGTLFADKRGQHWLVDWANRLLPYRE